MRRFLPVVALAMIVTTACGEDTFSEPSAVICCPESTTSTTAVAADAADPADVSPTTEPTTTTEPLVPTFDARIHAVTADELGASWRPECPVSVEDLRRVDMTHWNDEADLVTGALIVHADHVDDVTGVFAALFDAGFPIHSMAPVVAFEADDDASMAANNTSAFNCREIDGRPGVWSQHSYGRAVDINPLVNPWVRGDRVDPPEGAAYADRSVAAIGLIRAGDVVTTAFADIGWSWGGDWTTSKDYQHFSATGN